MNAVFFEYVVNREIDKILLIINFSTHSLNKFHWTCIIAEFALHFAFHIRFSKFLHHTIMMPGSCVTQGDTEADRGHREIVEATPDHHTEEDQHLLE